MPRLAMLSATVALALAVAILVQPLTMLALLTGFEPSTAAVTSRDAWVLVAVLRVCAALLITVAALLMALIPACCERARWPLTHHRGRAGALAAAATSMSRAATRELPCDC